MAQTRPDRWHSVEPTAQTCESHANCEPSMEPAAPETRQALSLPPRKPVRAGLRIAGIAMPDTNQWRRVVSRRRDEVEFQPQETTHKSPTTATARYFRRDRRAPPPQRQEQLP